jgi:hypothetical protein
MVLLAASSPTARTSTVSSSSTLTRTRCVEVAEVAIAEPPIVAPLLQGSWR